VFGLWDSRPRRATLPRLWPVRPARRSRRALPPLRGAGRCRRPHRIAGEVPALSHDLRSRESSR
jgi:hypothetical protein